MKLKCKTQSKFNIITFQGLESKYKTVLEFQVFQKSSVTYLESLVKAYVHTQKIAVWLRSYPKEIFGGRFVRGVLRYLSNRYILNCMTLFSAVLIVGNNVF